jgi:hypothetical protein
MVVLSERHTLASISSVEEGMTDFELLWNMNLIEDVRQGEAV